MAGAKTDSLLSYQFALEIKDGPLAIKRAFFRDVSGLASDYEVIEHKIIDAQGRPQVIKLPGRVSYAPITLKHGLTTDLSLWRWHQWVLAETVAKTRATVSITLFDIGYNPVYEWSLLRAWPSKIAGPQLVAEGNEIAVEELTLVYESLSREIVRGEA